MTRSRLSSNSDFVGQSSDLQGRLGCLRELSLTATDERRCCPAHDEVKWRLRLKRMLNKAAAKLRGNLTKKETPPWFEHGTARSAIVCSTTELWSHVEEGKV
jgi:hypothetical protein